MQIVGHLPTIIVSLVGLFFAFSNYQKHSKVALLSGIAFLILLISSLLASAFPLFSAYLTSSGKFDIETIGYIFAFVSFIFSIISAVSFALIISAIWKDRN